MAILSNPDLKYNNHSHENRRRNSNRNRRVYLDEGLTEPVQDQALGVH